jgi:LCP family protein required for cell wall assembly
LQHPSLHPIPRDRQLSRRRRPTRLITGCVFGCAALLLVPVLCISMFLVAYLIFPPERADIVVLGVDARPGQGYLTRTDSIMLLDVHPAALDASLLSIPRDVFIEVPGYGTQRINTINVLGEQEAIGYGPDLVKASFTESFGVQTEHYVRIDFNGFMALVDAVGGIDIEISQQIVDYEYPTPEGGIITVQFEPGTEHMDGERALQYARTRHQDDDYHRAARQQQVVDALIKKLADPRGILHWPGVVRAIHDHTDTDMTTLDMIQLAPGLLLGWSNRDHRVLQREDLIGTSAGYWIPNYDQLLPWIKDHFD